MAKDVLATIVGLGEEKSDLERRISGMQTQTEDLKKEIKALENEKRTVLAKEQQDFTNLCNAKEKEFSSRESVLAKEEADVEKRLEESEEIESEWATLKKAQNDLASEKKSVQTVKAQLSDELRKTELKQQQIDVVLEDSGLSPEKLEQKIIEAVSGKPKKA